MTTEKNHKLSKNRQTLDDIDGVVKLYKKFDPHTVSPDDSFSAFPLSQNTMKGLEDANFTKPTDIQRLSLGHSILGKDVVGGAKTGSGKTLALILPLLECLWRNRWTKMDGVGALIITPTRELAYQIYKVLNNVGKYHEFSVALLIGERQTLLFSATQTRRTEDLVRVSLRDPVFVAAHEHSDSATPDQLVQNYFVCTEEEKLNMLWSFLKNNRTKKTLVFVTCCKQARFITETFTHLRPGLYFTGLWGDLKQSKRIERFNKFNAVDGGAAMVCTDVASRGLDFRGMDWVLQMDCPSTVDDYIHRVGRTARMNRKGEAMLMLTPSQEPFVALLRQRNVSVTKVTVDSNKVFDVRNKITNLMVPFPSVKQFAQQSLIAYAKALYFSELKEVFDVQSIDFDALSRSYGLVVTPRIRFLRKKGIMTRKSVEFEKETSPEMATKTEEILLGNPSGSGGKNPFDIQCQNEMEEEEPFLKVSRRDVFNSITEVDVKEEILSRISSKKPISKTMMARKMIKRMGVVGKRKRFENERESAEEEDTEQQQKRGDAICC
ncbi:hypothetical protein niasHS_003906 [Heterodera schachtii]|uniref:ATP-dependent RNA helicase n=1 Tax=Heterodera schachtii TaxID=97005 RepID=A0ABD2K3K0_HETSC